MRIILDAVRMACPQQFATCVRKLYCKTLATASLDLPMATWCKTRTLFSNVKNNTIDAMFSQHKNKTTHVHAQTEK